MSITAEIEQLKTSLDKTRDEREQAEILLEILKKCTSINSSDSRPYIGLLLQLAEKLNEPLYKAWGLHHFANFKRVKGEYKVSIDLSRQALSIFNQLEEKKGIANCYNNVGLAFSNLGNYTAALKNHFAALKLREENGQKSEIANSLSNIGITYTDLGNYPEALKNEFTSLKLREEIGDRYGIAWSYNGIGNIYKWQSNYTEALKYYYASLKLKEENEDWVGISNSYNNIGNVYREQGKFAEAFKNHLSALSIRQKIGDKQGLIASNHNIGVIYELQSKLPEALRYYQVSLELSKEVGNNSTLAASYSGMGNLFYKQGKYIDALNNLLAANVIGEKVGHKETCRGSSSSIAKVYKAMSDFENALKYHEKYHQVETEILGEQAQKQLTSLNFMHNMEQKEKDLEIEQLRNVELKKERDRSESLLLNILPAEVAEELKNKGTADAKLFDDVTVLYTDFKSFTTVTERLTPQQLVDELNICFSAFDEIIGRYNIEKIKTVGDAYLAVSGLPLANANHASDVIHGAIEIRAFIKKRVKLKGENTFDIRIGVHSGSVVAGIVGVKKFAYDIWGDTVNTAARMEQNSEAGKINISETTYQLIKDSFNCEYRGEIEAKNKGKLKMYFVEK
jgi:adenylate cyclase